MKIKYRDISTGKGQWETHFILPPIVGSSRRIDYRRAPRKALPGHGRNLPCPCGSGKKFKRCCLPRINGDVRPQPEPECAA